MNFNTSGNNDQEQLLTTHLQAQPVLFETSQPQTPIKKQQQSQQNDNRFTQQQGHHFQFNKDSQYSPICIRTNNYLEKHIPHQNYSESPIVKIPPDFSPLISPKITREQSLGFKIFDQQVSRQPQNKLSLMNSPSPNLMRDTWDYLPMFSNNRVKGIDFENNSHQQDKFQKKLQCKLLPEKFNHPSNEKFNVKCEDNNTLLMCGETLEQNNKINNIYSCGTTATALSSQNNQLSQNYYTQNQQQIIEKQIEFSDNIYQTPNHQQSNKKHISLTNFNQTSNIQINTFPKDNLLSHFNSSHSKKFDLNSINSIKINQNFSTKEIFGEFGDSNSKSHDVNSKKKRITCNCKKSKCLKLYCDCFKDGLMCQDCNCVGCHNNEDYPEERENALKSLTNEQSIGISNAVIIDEERNMNRHKKGCNCKKSGCIKKYCECFQLGVKCSDICKCEGCKNCEKPNYSKNSTPLIKKHEYNQRNNGFENQVYTERYLENSQKFDSEEEQSNDQNEQEQIQYQPNKYKYRKIYQRSSEIFKYKQHYAKDQQQHKYHQIKNENQLGDYYEYSANKKEYEQNNQEIKYNLQGNSQIGKIYFKGNQKQISQNQNSPNQNQDSIYQTPNQKQVNSAHKLFSYTNSKKKIRRDLTPQPQIYMASSCKSNRKNNKKIKKYQKIEVEYEKKYYNTKNRSALPKN